MDGGVVVALLVIWGFIFLFKYKNRHSAQIDVNYDYIKMNIEKLWTNTHAITKEDKDEVIKNYLVSECQILHRYKNIRYADVFDAMDDIASDMFYDSEKKYAFLLYTQEMRLVFHVINEKEYKDNIDDIYIKRQKELIK